METKKTWVKRNMKRWNKARCIFSIFNEILMPLHFVSFLSECRGVHLPAILVLKITNFCNEVENTATIPEIIRILN